jgi:transposase-like protein
MPRPFGSRVNLTSEQRETLEGLVRAHSTPQALVFRCRIILNVAQSELRTNQQIADQLGCNRHTVGQWRERYVKQGLAGLQDAPRSGRPRSFSPHGTTDCRHTGQ